MRCDEQEAFDGEFDLSKRPTRFAIRKPDPIPHGGAPKGATTATAKYGAVVAFQPEKLAVEVAVVPGKESVLEVLCPGDLAGSAPAEPIPSY